MPDDQFAPRPPLVLVVEDEPLLCDLITRVVRGLGCRVTPCAGGEDALRALLATRQSFDLVITDVVMPGMDGLELIALVRLRSPTVPIIAVSGMTWTGQYRATHHIPDDVVLLQKPFGTDQLEAMVRRALDLPEATA